MSTIAKIHQMESRIAKNRGKSFEYFHSLPAEVRMVVVDEMEPVDRCMFSQCSFSSSMEAKKSKNYIYSLELRCLYDDLAKIKVRYDKEKKSGFDLKFREYSGKKFMECSSIYDKQLWRTELPGSTDLVQFAADYFKDILQEHHNIIKVMKVLKYLENKLNNFDFEIRSLNNLESFHTNFNSNILPVISKKQKPLKVLIIDGDRNTQELENYEISRVSEHIWFSIFKLNYHQFIQLSAPTVTIHIGELTEEDICKIIRNWQNQPTGGKEVSYIWNLGGSDFNISKLLRLLGENDIDAKKVDLLNIKHGFEKGMEAQLDRVDNYLSLTAKNIDLVKNE